MNQDQTDTEHVQKMRRIGALAAIFVWLKSFYFFEMNEQMTPIIQTIFKSLVDVLLFGFVLVIAMFSFSYSFYLVGRNQIQYDSPTEEAVPRYWTLPGSFEFIYETSLGEVGMSNDYFEAGDVKHNLSLWILFIISTFVLIIHMMNMLIAILTNSFEENQDV